MRFKKLRKLEATHKVEYSDGFTKRANSGIRRYANVDDVTLKRAPKDTFEGVANALILEAERAEQEAIRANPPRYCRAYVERADYSIMSLYSDYKDLIEDELRTWTDYRAERKKWRRCKYKFCVNVFPINDDNFRSIKSKRKDSRFCCETCRRDDHEAKGRYEDKGSYLPVYYYLPELSESVGDRTRKNESATELDKIERQLNKKKPERYEPIKRERFPVYPVITYNINDLTDEEIKERNLHKYVKKHAEKRRNIGKSRRDFPYICRGA